ncbi:MAG: MerR family DNA-binding transcriptional regulator, partial [Alteromonadaceae bacterium TMED7]
MRVKQIADALDISVDTVRYYTRIGLLVPNKSHN